MKYTKKDWVKVSKHPLYNLYSGIKQRCYYKKSSNYHRYGGRGIKICEDWLGSGGFLQFVHDMGDRPSNKHTIDRIDNDGDYTPENCVWATYKEQCITRSLRSDNKAGVAGISWDNTHGRWVARKTDANGNRVYAGSSKDLEKVKGLV